MPFLLQQTCISILVKASYRAAKSFITFFPLAIHKAATDEIVRMHTIERNWASTKIWWKSFFSLVFTSERFLWAFSNYHFTCSSFHLLLFRYWNEGKILVASGHQHRKNPCNRTESQINNIVFFEIWNVLHVLMGISEAQ